VADAFVAPPGSDTDKRSLSRKRPLPPLPPPLLLPETGGDGNAASVPPEPGGGTWAASDEGPADNDEGDADDEDDGDNWLPSFSRSSIENSDGAAARTSWNVRADTDVDMSVVRASQATPEKSNGSAAGSRVRVR
jgi:hypothetical protein